MASSTLRPSSDGVVGLGLRNQEPLLRALLLRASFCEDAALAAERVRAPHALAAPLALLRSSAFNVCLSDRLCFDAGFGQETLFTALAGPCGATLPLGHPAVPQGVEALPQDALVAPWQLLNHLPNSFALVNKAGLIRSLYRRYKAAAQGAYAPHVFECVQGPRAQRACCAPVHLRACALPHARPPPRRPRPPSPLNTPLLDPPPPPFPRFPRAAWCP
jgi:hypothetical protein